MTPPSHLGGMNTERIRRIKSPAIGATIAGLRYEPDAGFVVVELASGVELWVQVDGGGFHIFTSAVDESCLPVGIA